MKKILKLSSLAIALILISFSKNKKPSLKSSMKALNAFCNFVPSGNALVDGDTVSVNSFYMSTTEITNTQYRDFVNSLIENNQQDKLNIARVDSLQWEKLFKSSSGEKYGEYYHRHSAYDSYPVVNISKEGAQLFCEWLTFQYDSLSNGELNIKFRIPTRAEWLRAARGDHHEYSYSWKSPYLKNSKGMAVANFLRLGERNITKNNETDKFEVRIIERDEKENINFSDITAPALAYWPNEFGLYNMNGNVSEMIADGEYAVGGDWHAPGYDVRNESVKVFSEAHPTVGFRVVATYSKREK